MYNNVEKKVNQYFGKIKNLRVGESFSFWTDQDSEITIIHVNQCNSGMPDMSDDSPCFIVYLFGCRAVFYNVWENRTDTLEDEWNHFKSLIIEYLADWDIQSIRIQY